MSEGTTSALASSEMTPARSRPEVNGASQGDSTARWHRWDHELQLSTSNACSLPLRQVPAEFTSQRFRDRRFAQCRCQLADEFFIAASLALEGYFLQIDDREQRTFDRLLFDPGRFCWWRIGVNRWLFVLGENFAQLR